MESISDDVFWLDFRMAWWWEGAKEYSTAADAKSDPVPGIALVKLQQRNNNINEKLDLDRRTRLQTARHEAPTEEQQQQQQAKLKQADETAKHAAYIYVDTAHVLCFRD